MLDNDLPASTDAARASGRWLWVPFCVGGVLMVVWGLVTQAWRPILAVDIDQHRVDVAAPIPNADQVVVQTFRPKHNGLSSVELLAVRYDQPTQPADGIMTLNLQTASGNPIATQRVTISTLTHNQSLTLRFAPQPQSANQTYTLTVRGENNTSASVWGFSLESHGGGEAAGAGNAADLRLVTQYTLTLPVALRQLAQTAGRHLPVVIAALLVLPLPGMVLLLAARPRRSWDAVTWWGVALALGCAVWPLLWLWGTVLGVRWSGFWVGVVVAAGWLGVIALGIRSAVRRRDSAESAPPISGASVGYQIAVIAIVLIGYVLRLLAVRDMAFLPWVDASRHALITAVMANSGQTVTTYEPFLPVAQGRYHYGFHALSATLYLLLKTDLPLLMLALHQLLGALIPLTTYAAAWLLTGRRMVGTVAAFLIALPFFLPAYFVSWGRLTQLTALLLLPVVLGLAWHLVNRRADPPATRRERPSTSDYAFLSILIAGLFLIHIRVFLMFLPFAALIWLPHLRRRGLALALTTLGTLVLVGPRLLTLSTLAQTVTIFRPITGYNDFPVGYLTTGWERGFAVAGGVSIGVAIVAFILGKVWSHVPLMLALWVALLFALLSGERLGLPETWLINTNSLYISLFAPLALVLGVSADIGWQWLRTRRWLLQTLGCALIGAAVAYSAIFAIPYQITIPSAETGLAFAADRAGIAWLDANLPPDSRIAVNSWQWLGNTWAGQDGGAWITPLTGLTTTTPPVDYIYSRDLADAVPRFNAAARAVEDWHTPDALTLLRGDGVTHVYVGARGGFFKPEQLAANPGLRLLYAQDGVFVFALR